MFIQSLCEAGVSHREAAPKALLFERACAALQVSLAGRDSSLALFVPGRIEVLGKHTDYAGGRSLLCAAERGVCLVARPRADDDVRVTDIVFGEQVTVALNPHAQAVSGGWGLYVATVARRLARNFPDAQRGADIAFGSDLPVAAGMSSSSALVTSVMLALSAVNQLPDATEYRGHIHSLEDLAEYLGTIENGQDFRGLRGDAGVGTFGGSEDHTAMLCCRANELSLYRFCPVHHERQIPMQPGYRFVVGVSGAVAEKTGGARDTYNRASLAARKALDVWNAVSGRRDLTLGAAVEASADAAEHIREAVARCTPEQAAPFDRATLLQRFEQFFEETFVIIPRVSDMLVQGRVDAIGDLVDRSQRGAERGLQNQVPETVFLAESAREMGAQAASAFGAGFGGSVWALVAESGADDFCRTWDARYRSAFPQHALRAQFFTTMPGPGATRLGL